MGSIEITDSNTFPLALTKSNSDIRDITKRQGVYSKDFEILATNNNNRILKYIYNANTTAIGFRDCSVSENGMPILEGKITATNVKQTDAAEVYTLRIFSDNVDWYILLGNATIQDYDYGNSATPAFPLLRTPDIAVSAPAQTTNSTLDERYINASWLYPNLFDYVYPLISYGDMEQSTTVIENDFRPAIYIGKMLNKAFASVGYSLDSDFFTTGIGSRLILPYTGDAFVNSQSVITAQQFEATQSALVALNFGTFSTRFQGRIPLNVDVNDPSNIYNTSLFQIEINNGGIYVLDIDVLLNIRGFVNIFNITLDEVTDFYVGIREVGGQDILKVYTTFFNSTSVNLFGGTILPNGQPLQFQGTSAPVYLDVSTYELYVSLVVQSITEIGTGAAQSISLRASEGSTLKVNIQPPIVKGQTYTISNILPEIKVLDILGGLQNMFNLYFETNNASRTVAIEPKKDLIKSLANGLDFTDKLDIQNRITSDFIQDYNRSLQFSFGVDSNDKWQQNYNSESGTVFGSWLYNLGDQFKEGITDVGTKFFAATLLYNRHPFSVNGCPIPVMWNLNAVSPPKSFDFMPRVLYYKGLLQIAQANAFFADWNFKGTATNLVPTSFMLDPDNNQSNPINILYGDSLTANGLAKTYYTSDIAVIVDKRVHKMYFKITGTGFNQLDLFTPIYIDHVNVQGWYLINQVIDFKPNQEKTTVFELVKYANAIPTSVPDPTEIPTIQGLRRPTVALGAGTLTAGKRESVESTVTYNGSGNVGIIRGGGTVSGNGNIQTETDQHIFGNYNFGNDSVWIVGIGTSLTDRYNGIQLKPNGVFNVHGGNVRTIVGGAITDVYAVVGGRLENVLLLGNG
jgi:hypothetical protein